MGSQVHQISPQRASRLNPGFAAAPSHNPTPSRRVALGNMSASNINRAGFGGYGMSAGLKVGRQEGEFCYKIFTRAQLSLSNADEFQVIA